MMGSFKKVRENAVGKGEIARFSFSNRVFETLVLKTTILNLVKMMESSKKR